jgi:hypothetical protein
VKINRVMPSNGIDICVEEPKFLDPSLFVIFLRREILYTVRDRVPNLTVT